MDLNISKTCENPEIHPFPTNHFSPVRVFLLSTFVHLV